ncbi:MAG: SDR family oxidoreductase [Actinomycetia bacterium]|nr:SDR family oxidoreductase [Actinomycetes bacterium]
MGEVLKDKIAIVTGAGRGLGKAFALKYAEEGAKLLLPDISLERAERTAEEIRGKGGQAVAMETDIRDEQATAAVTAKVRDLYGGVDILLNNAALSYGIEPRPWTDWSVELWDTFFDINVRGTWLMCRAVAPLLVERARGKIINIASDVPRVPASETLLPYACSKTAVHQITQVLARALGPAGICVNSIAPGLTATEANLIQPDHERLFAATIALQCIKRREEPEDLVGTAVFLASEAADMVTGQLLIVDGGAAFG